MWPTLLSKGLALVTGINPMAIVSGVGSFIGVAAANVVKYWKEYAIALLIAGNVFFCWEWRGSDAKLVKERAAHSTDIASFKKAQADADAKAQATKAILLKESKANADQADANYSGLYAKYRSSLVRYAAHQGGTGTGNHYQLPTTQGGNGPSPDTDLPTTIVITGGDAQICAENTARLVAVHDWAVSLPKQETQP